MKNSWAWNIVTGIVALVVLVTAVWLIQEWANAPATLVAPKLAQAADYNPSVDPGTSLNRVKAPSFTLTDQFGQPVSLHSFRGKVVILAFIDSECTTVCPLTSVSMIDALHDLGPEASDVQLLAVNANPDARAVANVRDYSLAHGMMFHWRFLTGTLPQLQKVWHDYHMYSGIIHGQVDHTPGLYVIDQNGRERKLYLTQMAYAGIAAQGQILADEVQQVLHPGNTGQPPVSLPDAVPVMAQSLPSAADSGSDTASTQGAVTIKGQPHWFVFYATWLGERPILAAAKAMDTYRDAAKAQGLPSVIFIDEATTEPSTKAMDTVAHALATGYAQIAVDNTGETADALGVQDLSWTTLVSATGKVLYYHDGWLTGQQMLKITNQKLAKTAPLK
ncbi:MAG: SCO family protein [Firmicutes bacterium]|nr:SCO family protein [Bacillota bacterium]